MERYNLKSSIEFGYSLKDKTDYEYRHLRDNYDSFLKQPLKLEMFVPCIDGVPFNYSLHGNKEDFEKAKEKVLFEGFEFNGKYVKYSEDWLYLDEEICEAETIEFLITYNINLTPNAIKEIGLTI